MSKVVLSQHEKSEYILLTPSHLPARSGPHHGVHAVPSDLDFVLEELAQSPIVALDFETRGTDYSFDLVPVGVGFAWNRGSCYFEWASLSVSQIEQLFGSLRKHSGLVAHNVYFDGGVALQAAGFHLSWHMCTYSLYSMLANEGVPGRYWGLKQAQVELLLWEETNEKELDEWLVVNGYYTGNRRIDNSPEYLLAQMVEGKLRPDKGEMWRAPAHILGKYCILDAESTYLLHTHVLAPVLHKFPAMVEFVCIHWMHLIQVLIDQKMHGILMDVSGLHARSDQLKGLIEELGASFLADPEVAEHIREMEVAVVDDMRASAPKKFNNNGAVSKVWEKHNAKCEAILRRELPEYRFNINSGMQLRELFYVRLGMTTKIQTEKGEPSVSSKALRFLGRLGISLVQRSEYVKELSYITKYIELTQLRDSIHPSFRTPGTTTGRLSSKEPNLQQVPKSKEVMGLWRARPGYVFVDLDFAALEPTVTTEFSGDENMKRIYGNEASPYQDFYLYIASSIPGISDRVRGAGYDPENPTKEGVANAKKICKADRNTCKVVALACAYGAGVKKVHQTLEEQEVFLEWEEVEAIHSGYWRLFSQVKEFGRSLGFELKRNKGYVLNGMGRPMAVSPDLERDVLNRFIQSTGHDVLVRYIALLVAELNRQGLEWAPIIIDLHDASTIEVREDQADRAVQCFRTAMDQLNKVLGGSIRLRGTPMVGVNLAEVKEAE
jgi:DNA polymerase I-like protein with 3'-5' exonuclease and polymerase domains